MALGTVIGLMVVVADLEASRAGSSTRPPNQAQRCQRCRIKFSSSITATKASRRLKAGSPAASEKADVTRP
jgi:hypothetical protein